MKRYLPHLGIVVGICIAAYALFFSTSDEDRIREQLDVLGDTIRVTEDDTNPVVRLAHIKKQFSEIFTKEVGFTIPELSSITSGRTELAGMAAKAPQLWRTATVDLDGLVITVDEGGMAAVAVGDAHLLATRHGGEVRQDTRKVSISFEKIEGDWRIVSLSVSAKDAS